MVKKLYNLPRLDKIGPGKPTFPDINWEQGGRQIPYLNSFTFEESWLLYNLLWLYNDQDWMQTPSEMWEVFRDYQTLQDYMINVSVVKDLAERGIHLVSEFINKCYIIIYIDLFSKVNISSGARVRRRDRPSCKLWSSTGRYTQVSDFNKNTLARL